MCVTVGVGESERGAEAAAGTTDRVPPGLHLNDQRARHTEGKMMINKAECSSVAFPAERDPRAATHISRQDRHPPRATSTVVGRATGPMDAAH